MSFVKLLACIAQILLAFFVALPIYVVAKLARRLLRRGAPGDTNRMTGGETGA
jgi:hypothetical protein